MASGLYSQLEWFQTKLPVSQMLSDVLAQVFALY